MACDAPHRRAVLDHDVAVTGITAPSTVTAGEMFSVTVDVENLGTVDESTVNVDLTDDTFDQFTDQRTVNLPAGQSASVVFDFVGGDIGSHDLTALASITGDEDSTNNDGAATVEIVDQGTAPMVNGCLLSGDPVPGARITVTITGSNFVSGATANFGSRIAVQNVSFVSPEELDAAIKIHRRASGDKSATVTNPDGQNDTLPMCFTVN